MIPATDDELPLWGLARRGDPHTSHKAAVSATFAARHRRKILEALGAGPAGKCEIARRSNLTEQQVARRMRELRRSGYVTLTGQSAVSDAGREESEYQLHRDARSQHTPYTVDTSSAVSVAGELK
jgi:DNA-binding transcriptional ArsR family regulator